MDLQLSPIAVATLMLRLAKPKLSPMAQAAEKHEPSIRGLLLRTFREAKSRVLMDALEHVLGFGHPGTGAPLYVIEPIVQFIADALMGDDVTLMAPHRFLEAKHKDLPDLLHAAVKSGGRVAAEPLNMSFDDANPASIAWAHDHAAKRVVEISEDVRDAIRLTVVDSFESGMAPHEVARVIRANIGLTERDAGAVMKRQLKMLADGVDAAKATRSAEKYASELLTSRAQNIARTEAMQASNAGARELWSQARDKGLLDPLTQQKVWIATDGACPQCEEVDGETVGLDEDFSVGVDPPLHPNCRCTMGLA